MGALHIAYKDMQIFFRDRGSLIWVFLLPMIFIVLFTFLQVSAQQQDDEEPVIELAVVNLDGDQGQVRDFLQGLRETGKISIEQLDEESASALLREEKLIYLLTIPPVFSQSIALAQPVAVELERMDGERSEFESLLLIIEGVARDISLKTHILASLEQMREMQGSSSPETQVFTVERMKQQAETQFAHVKETPLIAVVEHLPRAILDRQVTKEEIPWVQLVVPGFTVLFVFLTAQITARFIFEEKTGGSFRRLLSAPLTRFNILTGKLLPNLIIVMIQIAVIFGASMLLLPVLGIGRLSLGKNAPVLLVVSFFTALCSTSLGIFISSLARTQGQISGLGQVILWVAGLLGGCIVPLSVFNNPQLNAVSKFVPHSWAINGFQDVMIRGYGLTDVLPELGVLLVFSLVFFAVGLWRFDFE